MFFKSFVKIFLEPFRRIMLSVYNPYSASRDRGASARRVTIPQMMLLFCEDWISIHGTWKASFYVLFFTTRNTYLAITVFLRFYSRKLRCPIGTKQNHKTQNRITKPLFWVLRFCFRVLWLCFEVCDSVLGFLILFCVWDSVLGFRDSVLTFVILF